MSEKVSIRMPAHLARYVRPDAPAEEKLKVIGGAVSASPPEQVVLLFFLCYDRDQEIRAKALAEMKGLSRTLVGEILASADIHPRLKELLEKLHPAAVPAALPASAEETGSVEAGESDEPAEEVAEASDGKPEDSPEEKNEEEEEAFKSKYQQAQDMGVGDKIKMALTGDKEWRNILIKDSNKLVNGAVVKNPRITEPEILAIAKSVIQNDEILRVICMNKEWVKNYEIRKALVLNNKTSLPVALRFMGFLTEKDLGAIAKSKNVSSVLSNNARRMLLNKKKS